MEHFRGWPRRCSHLGSCACLSPALQGALLWGLLPAPLGFTTVWGALSFRTLTSLSYQTKPAPLTSRTLPACTNAAASTTFCWMVCSTRPEQTTRNITIFQPQGIQIGKKEGTWTRRLDLGAHLDSLSSSTRLLIYPSPCWTTGLLKLGSRSN